MRLSPAQDLGIAHSEGLIQSRLQEEEGRHGWVSLAASWMNLAMVVS